MYYFFLCRIKASNPNSLHLNFWNIFIDVKSEKMEKEETIIEPKRKDSFVGFENLNDTKNDTPISYLNPLGEQLVWMSVIWWFFPRLLILFQIKSRLYFSPFYYLDFFLFCCYEFSLRNINWKVSKEKKWLLRCFCIKYDYQWNFVLLYIIKSQQ